MTNYEGSGPDAVSATQPNQHQRPRHAAQDLRDALLGRHGPLVPALFGVVILLLVAVVGLIVFAGASDRSFTAKGMIRDSTGYMYDSSDSRALFEGTGLEGLIGQGENKSSCVDGDMDERSILTIADAEGKVLATTPLTFDPSLSAKRGPDIWFDRGWCGFTFEVPDIKSDSEYFRLTVSNTIDGIPPVERQKLIDGVEIQLSGGSR